MTDAQKISLTEEAESLPIHVKMCAMRHESIMARIEEAAAEARIWRTRIDRVLWALLTMVGGGIGLGTTQVLPVIRAMAPH